MMMMMMTMKYAFQAFISACGCCRFYPRDVVSAVYATATWLAGWMAGWMGVCLSQAPILFYLCVHPLSQNYQIWRVGVSWGQPSLPFQESGVSALPNFGGPPVLCLHPLAQKDQIWHGNTYGEGRVFRSIIPLHLHKCVARFVSDSWVSFFNFRYPAPLCE